MSDPVDLPDPTPELRCRWCGMLIWRTPKGDGWAHGPARDARRTCCNGAHQATPVDLPDPTADTKWWAVRRHVHLFGPFRSRDKAGAWARVYHGTVEPMLPPDIDNDRTYEATRSPGPGRS